MKQRWRDASPILAYDDLDIRVLFQPGGSDVLLVTFGDALTLASELRFAADAMVRKHGYACLGFMAHQANWFPADAVARALPSLAYTLESFRHVLTYGCSMGAYAAIKHAAVLGATEVLALGPQWSIDPAECAFDCGYRDFYQPRMAGMGIRAADLSGRIALLYDPAHALDRRHADAVAALSPSVTRIHVHSAGHHLAPTLAGSDFMAGLMQAWLRRDTRAALQMLAARRRQSPIRIQVLLARAVLRHPRLALAAVEQLARSGRIGLVEAEPHLLPLLRNLITQRRLNLAGRVLDMLGPLLQPGHEAVLRQDFAGAGEAPMFAGPWVRTVHGTTMFYDAVAGRLCHRTTPVPAAEAFGLHPASLARGTSLLVVRVQGVAMSCARVATGRLELVRVARAEDACVRAAPVPSGFALAVGTNYLCASPDGQIRWDRNEVNAWEIFGSVSV